MPVKIQSTGGGKYRVSTPQGTKAKHTTRAKAERQKRLLNAVEHGWKPTGKPAKRNESIETTALKVLSILLGEGKSRNSWLDERPVGCTCPTRRRNNPKCPIDGKVGIGFGVKTRRRSN